MYQETSREAYHSLKKVNNKQMRVYEALQKLKSTTDLRIAGFLNWPINRVTPRRGELVEMGLISHAGTTTQNGRTVIVWKTNDE